MLKFPKSMLGVPPILIVALFFLPWVAFSCGSSTENVDAESGMTFTMTGGGAFAEASGFNLMMGEIQPTGLAAGAVGGEVDETSEQVTGDFEVVLIPAFVLFAMAVVFISDQLLKGLYVGSATGALLVMVLYALDLQGDLSEVNDLLTAQGETTTIEIQYQIWWWLMGGLIVLMMIGGVLYDNRAR